MRKFNLLLLGMTFMLGVLITGPAQAELKGLWTFDDPTNTTKATVGNDLTLVGADTPITGVNAGDGAVVVPKGTYYKCNAAIPANGGGSWVNEFTLLFDIKYPQASADKWRCFFNTNINNSNDGDYFIKPDNTHWGVGSMGYKTVTTSADTWYRVVMSVKLGTGGFFKVYVDGNLVATHTSGLGLDGRMSLYTSSSPYTLLLLADNDGDDAEMDCSTLAIWDTPLTDAEVADLGSAGDAVVRKAWSPEPATGQTDVPIDQVLTWKTGVDPNEPSRIDPTITGHYVYLGTDKATVANATPATAGVYKGFVTELDNPSYNPGGLDKDTVYYWRVDERLQDDANVVKGSVWHFETVPSVPVINADTPEDAYVFAGEDAEFSVDATDPLGGTLSYQWYFDPNLVATGNEVALADGADYSGATSATLTVLSAQQADAGYYYCVVENAKHVPISSSKARLVIKKMIAHWPLDDDYADVVGGHDGTLVGDPATTLVSTDLTGSGDKAISLDGTQSYLAVPYSPELNTPAFSVAVWCNVQGNTGAYRCPVSNRSDLPQKGWIMYARSNNRWSFWTGSGVDVGWYQVNDGNVELNKWTFVCITMEKTGNAANGAIKGIQRLYVNGAPAGMATDVTYMPNSTSQFQIGAGTNESPTKMFFFKGLIDDVKMYNYALTPEEVASQYVAVKGGTVCAEPISVADGDLNQDCKVDLEDMALLASQWLECGWVPVSYCP